jgi:hypothetical protein
MILGFYVTAKKREAHRLIRILTPHTKRSAINPLFEPSLLFPSQAASFTNSIMAMSSQVSSPRITPLWRATQVAMDEQVPFVKQASTWWADATPCAQQALRQAALQLVALVPLSGGAAATTGIPTWRLDITLAVPQVPIASAATLHCQLHDEALQAEIQACLAQVQRLNSNATWLPPRVDRVVGGFASLNGGNDSQDTTRRGLCMVIAQLSISSVEQQQPCAPLSLFQALLTNRVPTPAVPLVSESSFSSSDASETLQRQPSNGMTPKVSLPASSMELLALVSAEIHERRRSFPEPKTAMPPSPASDPKTVSKRRTSNGSVFISDQDSCEDEERRDEEAPRPSARVTSTGRSRPKVLVQHHYRDFSRLAPPSDDEATTAPCPSLAPFPLKLHLTLEQIERDGLAHIISWLPHGRSFKIHDSQLFLQVILPKVRHERLSCQNSRLALSHALFPLVS